MAEKLPVILVLVDYYPPAFRAGGPTRSVPGIVTRLAEDFRFRVVTRNRDLGARGPLAGIPTNHWTPGGEAECLYLSPGRSWPGGLWWALRRVKHDILYLNSIFSIGFSLWPLLLRRVRLLPRAALVISPRGELDPGALGLKPRRKRLYLGFVHQLGLLNDAVWHATSSDEGERIKAEFGGRARVAVVPAIPMAVRPSSVRPPKEVGSLSLVFLGRISKMKNLLYAITALYGARGRIQFDVVGPIEDEGYWRRCQQAAQALPTHIRLRYSGGATPTEVPEILGRHHLFILPSLGENFGHAIVESLVAGCPVLISDQTPWRQLEFRRAGWDLPLSDVREFRRVIERCVDMDAGLFAEWSEGARQLGIEIAAGPGTQAAYRSLFEETLRIKRPPLPPPID
jgi:glycosyltransferase involved in cell wall biosynthesis